MTSYEEIYERFLRKIDDYDLIKLLEVDKDSFKDLLRGYLEESIINFPQCDKDLTDFTIVKNPIANENSQALEEPVQDETELGAESDAENQALDESEDLAVQNELYEEEYMFTVDLTLEEKEILAKGMILAWLSPKLMFAENMEKSIGDRDYKSVQGYQYLQQLNSLRKSTEDELRRYTVSYTYNSGKFNLEDW